MDNNGYVLVCGPKPVSSDDTNTTTSYIQYLVRSTHAIITFPCLNQSTYVTLKFHVTALGMLLPNKRHYLPHHFTVLKLNEDELVLPFWLQMPASWGVADHRQLAQLVKDGVWTVVVDYAITGVLRCRPDQFNMVNTAAQLLQMK